LRVLISDLDGRLKVSSSSSSRSVGDNGEDAKEMAVELVNAEGEAAAASEGLLDAAA